MPKINITKPFTLKRDNGTEQAFRAGVYDVSDEDAGHWFFQLHTDHPPEGHMPPPSIDLSETRRVKVVKPFRLQRDDGTDAYYRVGEQDMPVADADHQFTAYHLEDAPDPQYPPGTPQYAEQMIRAEAARKRRAEVMAQAAHQAAEQARDKARAEAQEPDEEEEDRDVGPEKPRSKRKRGRKSAEEAIAENEQHAAEEHPDMQRSDLPPDGNTGEQHEEHHE